MPGLPRPAIDYFPQIYRNDPKALALAAQIDTLCSSAQSDIITLGFLKVPERAPSVFLDVLGDMFAAGILAGDNDTQKRAKIAVAVDRHKRRGSFAFDAKGIIDAIAGGDSKIVPDPQTSDAVFIGDGVVEGTTFWSTFAGDGINLSLGDDFIGGGAASGDAGVIWIDVDNPTLSATDQALLEESLEDVVPAYYIAHIGYFDVGGNFVIYFTMS